MSKKPQRSLFLSINPLVVVIKNTAFIYIQLFILCFMEKVYLCQKCLYPITNPVCTECLSKHILVWIRDRKPKKKQAVALNYFIRNLLRENEENPTDTNCVICNKKTVSFCGYCLTEKAKEFMRKNMEEKITKQFEEDFDSSQNNY